LFFDTVFMVPEGQQI